MLSDNIRNFSDSSIEHTNYTVLGEMYDNFILKFLTGILITFALVQSQLQQNAFGTKIFSKLPWVVVLFLEGVYKYWRRTASFTEKKVELEKNKNIFRCQNLRLRMSQTHS